MRSGETHVPIPNTYLMLAWEGEDLSGRWYYAGDGMGEQAAAGAHLKGKSVEDTDGDVAQLGEHLPCKQGVKGSNPSISIGQGSLSEPPWLKRGGDCTLKTEY